MKDESTTELHGADAVEFARKHLRQVGNDSTKWETEYIDDATGERWVMDYPESQQHGGGIPRLVKRFET